jgi:hypothetical protein
MKFIDEARIEVIAGNGGNDVVTVDHNAYLIAGPGTYCIHATLWYSHQWAGHSNYQDVLVDQTDGTNCFYYDGFSTHVEASGEQAHTLSAYPNPTTDFIHVDGIDSGRVVTISDMSGRTVSQATHTISGPYTCKPSRGRHVYGPGRHRRVRTVRETLIKEKFSL